MTLGAPNLNDNDFIPLVSNHQPSRSTLSNWKNVAAEPAQVYESKVVTQTKLNKPQFQSHQLIYEADEDEYDMIPEVGVEDETKEDDGWTTVEKKVKPKRDKVQDALDNGDAPLSDEDAEDSVWNDQPEEYETYWDRKP
jgi:hypothetical protein